MREFECGTRWLGVARLSLSGTCCIFLIVNAEISREKGAEAGEVTDDGGERATNWGRMGPVMTQQLMTQPSGPVSMVWGLDQMP